MLIMKCSAEHQPEVVVYMEKKLAKYNLNVHVNFNLKFLVHC